MESVIISCRPKDIRRVAILCRCGARSVAEMSVQMAQAKNLHVCSGCSAVYLIQLDPNGNVLGMDRKTRWSVIRDANSVREGGFIHASQPTNSYSFHCEHCQRELTLEQFMRLTQGKVCPFCSEPMPREVLAQLLNGKF